MFTTKKIVSLILALVCLISTIAFPVKASAASEATYIIPGAYCLESAAKSKVMFNLYGNQCANCTKVCTWVRDHSPEQIVVIHYEGNGAYRIYFQDHPGKCVDVLRNTSPLKKNMPIELYDDNDDIAQLVIPHKVNEHTVIFRMKADPSLAISVNKTSNGSQLVLKPFNASDKKQQWIFRSTDASFRKVQAFTANEPITETITVDPSIYTLTKTAYTVDGKLYRRAKLTENFGSKAPAGTLFWLTTENQLVTAPTVLDQLQDLVLINELRPNLRAVLNGWQSAAAGYYDVYTHWARIGSFGSVMGASLGVAVGAAASGGIQLADVSIEVLGVAADPQNVTASAYLGMLRTYATNVAHCAHAGIQALQQPITSYQAAEDALALYNLAYANQKALDYLAGPTVREIANSKWYNFSAHYLRETVMGFANAVMPNLPAAQLTNYITMGSASLADFATSSGVSDVYAQAMQQRSQFLGHSYPTLHQQAAALADALKNSDPNVAYGLQRRFAALTATYKPGARQHYFEKARAYDCHGFACEAMMILWNTGKPTPSNKQYVYYKATASNSFVDQIRPGDMVRYRLGKYDHTIVITQVDEEYVYYADCNGDLKSTIVYHQRMSKDKLDELLCKPLLSQVVSTRGYICHYRGNEL